jgi:hypothetical protein
MFRAIPQFNGWEFWDVTPVGPARVHVWVDSWGESFFGSLDLLWLLYTAGAIDDLRLTVPPRGDQMLSIGAECNVVDVEAVADPEELLPGSQVPCPHHVAAAAPAASRAEMPASRLSPCLRARTNSAISC